MGNVRKNADSVAEGCLVKWSDTRGDLALEWSRSQVLTLYKRSMRKVGVRNKRVRKAAGGAKGRFSRVCWSKRMGYDEAVAFVRERFPSAKLRFDNSDDYPLVDEDIPANEVPMYCTPKEHVLPASEVYGRRFEARLEYLADRAARKLPLFDNSTEPVVEDPQRVLCMGCNKAMPGDRKNVRENGWVRRLNRTTASFFTHNHFDHICPKCYAEHGLGDEVEIMAHQSRVS